MKATYAPGYSGGVGCLFRHIAILFLLAVSAPVSRAEFARVGYINSREGGIWDHYLQLFNGRYTHIITAFLIPVVDATGAADGSVINVDAADSFGALRVQEARDNGINVLVSIGGSEVPYQTYLDIDANTYDPGARARFISEVVTFVDNNNYNGVDMNFEGWGEGISEEDLEHIDQLILDLADAIRADGHADRLVTVTLAPLYALPVSPSPSVVNDARITMAHHMGYDFDGVRTLPNGPYRVPGNTDGLSGGERSVYGAFSYLQAQGYDLSKVTGGVPFYTYGDGAWIGIPWNTIRGPVGYWSSIALHPDYLEKWDPETSYWANDAEAIAAKIAEYRKIGLAGVMVWQVGHEGVEGDLSTALYNAATSPDPALVFPQMLNFQPPLAGAPASAKPDSGGPYGLRVFDAGGGSTGSYGWR